MDIFKKRLRELRLQMGYTQRDIAKKLDIAQPSYIRYENGNAQPTLENLCKLADIFDVSVDFLLGRADI